MGESRQLSASILSFVKLLGLHLGLSRKGWREAAACHDRRVDWFATVVLPYLLRHLRDLACSCLDARHSDLC